MSEMIEIERRPGLTAEAFRSEFLANHKPVVVPGGIASWPAVSQWTKAYFQERCGDKKVTVRAKRDYENDQSTREEVVEEEIDLARVFEIIEDPEAPDLSYVRQTPILQHLPELLKDIEAPPYLPESMQGAPPLMWVGPEGTVAQMHWDPGHNIFTQVKGAKKVILVSPEQSHLTYGNLFPIDTIIRHPFLRANRPQLLSKFRLMAGKIMRGGKVQPEALAQVFERHLKAPDLDFLFTILSRVNNCHVDAENPDYERHGRFAEAQRYVTDLEAGDLLFIPYCWRHYLRSTAPSISVNWFFDPEPGEIDAAAIRNKTLVEHIAGVA